MMQTKTTHIYEPAMGGYNVVNTPGRNAVNVFRHYRGGWGVMDVNGDIWDRTFRTREAAADAAIAHAREANR